MNLNKIKTIFLLLSAIVLLSACSNISTSDGVFKKFTVGVTTHEGNEIWGRAVRFDTGWGMPSGSISCCWESTGATTTAMNQPMPKEIYVEWIEKSTQLLYRTHVKISPDITKLANNLPGYTWGGETTKEVDMTLIIGMGKGGEAVIWLSNARAAGNKTGRVLYVVGKAKAYSEPWIPPSKRK